jgi:adenosylcobinamide-GDP ribazoletransferase
MLTKFAVLAEMSDRLFALLLAPTLGRWAMSAVFVLCPYARPEGVGRTMKDSVRLGDLILATAIALLVVGGIAAWTRDFVSTLALGVAALVAAAIAGFAMRRIGGVTGDVCGAVCELTECAVLLAVSARGAIG